MIRNLKVLGLALVAVFAMSAVAASGASAATEFHCESVTANCWVTAEQSGPNEFTSPAVSATGVKCNTVKFEGTAPKTTKTIEVTPEYKNCTAFGFATTDIKHNGCKYHLELTDVIDHTTDGTPFGTITTEIKCTGTNKIEITPTLFGASVCTVTVGPQMLKPSEIDVENVAGSNPMDMILTSTLEGIAYTVDGEGCKSGSAGPHTDGKLHGKVTAKGFEDVNGVEGAQVGLTVG